MAATTTAHTPDDSEGMAYLDTLPKRVVTVYLPLFVILVVLLFPFYWMALTAIKPDDQLIDMETYNPFWVVSPTLKHITKLLFQTNYPLWLWNTMMISVAATVLSLFASVLAAYAIVRIRYKGAVAVGARGLEYRLAVERQAQPGEAVEDHLHGRLGRALAIGVLDAQKEAPAGMFRV